MTSGPILELFESKEWKEFSSHHDSCPICLKAARGRFAGATIEQIDAARCEIGKELIRKMDNMKEEPKQEIKCPFCGRKKTVKKTDDDTYYCTHCNKAFDLRGED